MKIFKLTIVVFFSLLFADFACAEPVILNRTVLTVQTEVYTAAQSELLLALWGEITQTIIPIESLWNPSVKINTGRKQEEFLASYKKWPKDAQELLYVALVWSEIKRLNLFSVSESDIDKAVVKYTKILSGQKFSGIVRRFLSPEGKSVLKNCIERVLRAQTYLKVRGNLDKNISLSNTFWYWHSSEKSK